MAVCSDCTRNVHLKARIEKDGIFAQCRECRQFKQQVFEIGQLADIFSDVIQRNFEVNPQRYVFHDEDQDYTMPYGDSLDTVVAEMLEQDVSFLDELLEAIVETDDAWPPDGEVGFFNDGDLYARVEWRESADYFTPHWRNLMAELKHKRRFFSEAVRSLFEHLFKDVDKVKTWEELSFDSPQSVVQYVREGAKVYRGRVIEQGDLQNVLDNPAREVGPTPRSKARSGRMSPEGVVALYCALEDETAIAELRPAIGDVTAVISLSFTRQLRLLNFARLERVLDAGWGAYLAEDYDRIRDTRVFLRKLHDLISQPVAPGHEADYLITQTMAEYLSHVHEPQFDGIMFKSVQRAGGTNVVIFSEKDLLEDSTDSFPVEYVTSSLKFHRTEKVTYGHVPLKPTHSKSGISLSPDNRTPVPPLVSNLADN
jgi:hypothetical protein